MSAYTPVPAAPWRTGWAQLEEYLHDHEADGEWGVAPSFDTLGRMVSALDTDVQYLVELRDDLDRRISTITSWISEADVREADDAR